MRSLSGLKARIGELLRARAEQAARPHVLCFLPLNGREPADAPGGPFITEITPFASVHHYDASNPPVELTTAGAVVPETDDPFRHY